MERRGALRSAVGRSALGLLLAWLIAPGAAADDREYRLKAAFLYNFTKFVSWPQPAGGETTPFRVCVAADRGVVEVIQSTFADKTAAGRPIETLELEAAEQVRSCHLAFIGGPQRAQLDSIQRAAVGSSALLVSEAEAFGRPISMINLVVSGNRIRLEVDPEAVARARLKISSKLLGLAQIVGRVPASASDPP